MCFRRGCRRGDIVVTQDYGVAALALGKGAKAIHLKGPPKRTEKDDKRFAESFERLITETEAAE